MPGWLGDEGWPEGEPLLCVTTGALETAGAVDAVGAGADELAVTAAGTEEEPAPDAIAAEPPGRATPAVDPPFGFWCRVTWTVRRITWVRTFGFGGVAAEGELVAWLELSATPANPPRPAIVAAAAIFALMVFTCGPPEVGMCRAIV